MTCVADESAAEKLAVPAIDIDEHKLSFGQIKEPALHPVKLHLSDQPKSGLPSSLTRSLQPETPEHLQGDEVRGLSTIYSGSSYSGHSSGDRGGPASSSPHLVSGDAEQASGRAQHKLVPNYAHNCLRFLEHLQPCSSSSCSCCLFVIIGFVLLPVSLALCARCNFCLDLHMLECLQSDQI